MIETLGDYRLLERIGADRAGELFRARDTRHGRTVTVRVLGPRVTDDSALRAELLEAARRVSRLSHPSIATLFEVGEDAQHVFLVSEHVAGDNLRAVIAGSPLNPRRAVDVAVQIADGLADAHAQGIAHGALTADTVIVSPRGNLKLIDCGLARWTTATAAHRARVADDDLDAAIQGDLSALGVILRAMLVGSFDTQPKARQPADPNGPLAELERILGRLAGGGSTRYESAATVAAELRNVAARFESEAPPPTLRVAAGPSRRSGIPWLLALLALVAVAALIFLALRG